MNLQPVGTVSLSHSVHGGAGQDRTNGTRLLSTKPSTKVLLIFLGYIIGTFLKQVEIIREPSHVDFSSKVP